MKQEYQTIIKFLKTGHSYTLAQLARKLQVNKSTLFYQLKELVSDGMVVEKQLSVKKKTYALADKNTLENLIERKNDELYNLLLRTEVEGLNAYTDLLNLVANGESDVIGYGNIEYKIIPELESILENYRDRFAATERTDRFVVPDSLKNIELLRDHFRKPEWKKVFKGRIIPRDTMYVNADIYVWDSTVGICSFDNNKFSVSIHTDPLTFQTYQALLEVLWNTATEPEAFTFKKTS